MRPFMSGNASLLFENAAPCLMLPKLLLLRSYLETLTHIFNAT